MKNAKILICIGTVSALSILFAISCNKKVTPRAEDTGYTSEQALAEKSFSDVQTISDQASTVSSGSLNFRTAATTIGGCATVTHSGNTITINFGNSDCTCRDGRSRRGEIIVNYTGNYADSGSVHTITFNNFYQNDNKITGTKTVTNMGMNALGQPYFNVTVIGSVTLSGGGTISSNWRRVRTWISGSNTPSDFTDDVYSITGSGTLTRQNGTNVSVSISDANPLIMACACKWIEAGKVTYTLPGGLLRTLDFGNTPACTGKAVLTLPNGTSYNITLP